MARAPSGRAGWLYYALGRTRKKTQKKKKENKETHEGGGNPRRDSKEWVNSETSRSAEGSSGKVGGTGGEGAAYAGETWPSGSPWSAKSS